MTLTEQWLGRITRLAEQIARHVASLVTEPGQRTFWLGLAVATAIAVGLSISRGVRRWPAVHRFVGPSARVDYGLILSKPIIAAVFVLPLSITALGVAMFVIRTLRPWVGVSSGSMVQAHPIVVGVVYTVMLFVAWDASRFGLHWLMHRVDWLWQFHQVHHSATSLTPFTLYRVHPVESFLYRARGVVVTGGMTGLFTLLFGSRLVELELLGINAVGFSFSILSGNLRHSHVWWSFGPRLERWLISPAQHQLHHAADAHHNQANYGTWLAVWDRLAGSHVVATEPPERFGLEAEACNHRPHSLLSALIDPVLSVLGRLTGRGGVGVSLVVGLMLAAGVVHAAPSDAGPSDGPSTPGATPPTTPPADETDQAPPADGPRTEGDAASDARGSVGDGETPGSTASAPADDPADDPGDDEVDIDLSDLGADPLDSESDGEGEDDPEAPPDPADADYDIATPTVSIIGEPEELPRVVGSAYSVDEKTLEREEHDDIHRVLRSVPGVYVRGEDGYGLRPNIGLRGADPNRSAKVTLMEDGVLFGPAPYSAPAAYYFPMTTRLVGVEVFKGPAAVRFGPNTIGGAINLKTREIPNDLATGIDVAAGTYGYGKVHGYVGKSWKRFGVLAEGVRVQTNGFKDLDGDGNTGFRKNEFMLKGRVHGDPGARVYHQFDVKLGLSTEVSNETYLGITDDDFDETPYRRYRASALDRMQWWRTQAQASYFLATGIVEFQSTAYRHDFARAWKKFNRFNGGIAPDPYTLFQDPEGGTNGIYLALLRGEADSFGPDENLLIGTNSRNFVSQGLQNTVRISPRTRYVDQVIEVGARLHNDRIGRNHNEDQYQMLSGTLVRVADSRLTTTLNRGEAVVGSFHVADEIRIVDRFTVSPGARVEVIHTDFVDRTPILVGGEDPPDERSSSTDVVFLPGIGVHVQATPWLGVLAGVHSGFSPKAPQQADDPDAEAERSINYEAGLRAGWKGLRGEAIAFMNDYSNLLSECTVSQGCEDEDVGTQFSGGEVRVAGTELLAGYRHEFKGPAWIDATATHTFTWSRFRTTFDSGSPLLGQVEEGDAIPYLPEHVASLQLAGGMRRWGAHAQLQYTGQMRDVPGTGSIPEQERIERFLTLDLGGNVFVTPRAQIYLNLGNVTASSYMVSRRPFGARPGRRFSVIGGFKYNFG